MQPNEPEITNHKSVTDKNKLLETEITLHFYIIDKFQRCKRLKQIANDKIIN